MKLRSESSVRRTAAFVLVFLFTLPFAAMAQEEARISIFDLLDPPLSYSADFTFTTRDRSVEGRVFHVPGKERREYRVKGEEQILLLRRDRQQAYWILPSRRLYVALSLKELAKPEGGLENLVLNRRADGEEVLDGVVLRRFLVDAEAAGAAPFSAVLWMNSENVVVRATAENAFFIKPGAGGELAMTNLQYKPLDESRFELPEGYMGITLKEPDFKAIDRMFSSLSGGKKAE